MLLSKLLIIPQRVFEKSNLLRLNPRKSPSSPLKRGFTPTTGVKNNFQTASERFLTAARTSKVRVGGLRTISQRLEVVGVPITSNLRY